MKKAREMGKSDENSYGNILKGTSIFGGVQTFNILMSIVRLKFVAILLGPVGMGMAGLYNNVLLIIQQISGLGLNLSVVKEVGRNKEDENAFLRVLKAVRILMVVTSCLGLAICVVMAGQLSEWTFGTRAYRWQFVILGFAVALSVAGGLMMSVLQGMHEVRSLSKASLVGSAAGLFAGVPLYWIFGTKGIVPAILVFSLSTFLWYYLSLRRCVPVGLTHPEGRVDRSIVRDLLKMGLILMSGGVIASIVTYLINIYIRIFGNMDDVGFYQSCTSMTTQYSAVVFSAMAMDYLPRLAGVSADNVRMRDVINRQMEIVALLVTPIACGVILFAPAIMSILQSEMFLVAVPLLRCLGLSVIAKALMYPIGYVVFAKDNKRLYFWMESVGANILTFMLSLVGYHLWGLVGMGYAAIVDCLICLVVYLVVNRKMYGYTMSRQSCAMSVFGMTSGLTMLILSMNAEGTALYVVGICLLVGISIFSLKSLKKKLVENKTKKA